MSWARQVKIYYAVAVMMLISIIFSSIVAVTMKAPMNMEIFIVMVLVQILIQYFQQKNANKYLTIFLPSALALGYELIRYPTSTAIVFTIFIVIVNLYFCKKYEEAIYYQTDKNTLINGLYILFVLSILLMMMDSKIMPYVYRNLFIYIIFMVVALREALGYFCGIQRKKKEKKMNLVLVSMAVLLTIEPIFKFCTFIGERVWRVILLLIYKIMDLILYVIYDPVGWVINKIDNWIRKLMAGKPEGAKLEITTHLEGAEKKNVEVSEVNPYIAEIIAKVLAVIILILIVFIIVKIIKSIKTREGIQIKEEDFEETVEDIEEIVEDKITLKKIFRKRGTPREEVLYVYGKLISISQKKGIFKSFMTPKQLKNEIKVKMDDIDEIDGVTDIYNKARFSTHEIIDTEEEKVTKMVNIITKKMK